MSGNDVDDFFGGYPSLKFPTVGTSHTITVTDVERSQQTDFDTGEPLLWDDGKPRYQLIVTGRLAEADWDDDEDDDDPDAGMRRLFVKSGLTKALALALKAVKIKPSQMPGGDLTMEYTEDGPKPKRGYPPKIYAADFIKGTPPASKEVDEDTLDQPDEEDEAPPARRTRSTSNGSTNGAATGRAKAGASARSGRGRSDSRSTQHQDEDAPDF